MTLHALCSLSPYLASLALNHGLAIVTGDPAWALHHATVPVLRVCGHQMPPSALWRSVRAGRCVPVCLVAALVIDACTEAASPDMPAACIWNHKSIVVKVAPCRTSAARSESQKLLGRDGRRSPNRLSSVGKRTFRKRFGDGPSSSPLTAPTSSAKSSS